MKMRLLTFVAFFLGLALSAFGQTSCEIEGIYALADRANIVCGDGECVAIDGQVYVKQKTVILGTFEDDVTRASSDLYKIENTNFVIKTRYCYEYATWQKALVRLTCQGCWSLGKVIFVTD